MAIELTGRRVLAGPIFVSKQQLAGIITVLVYAIGTSGLLFGDFNFFIRSTPFVLVLNFLLIVWTEKSLKVNFFIFLFASFIISMLAEIIGIRTGSVFGTYAYSNLLGIKLMEVPVIIGINWLVLIYGVGNVISLVFRKFKVRSSIALIAGGAFVTTFFDWIMEPAATRLGYWHWVNQTFVPVSNYISWFLLSAILISLYKKHVEGSINYFAIFLLIIQAIFFITLRIFLP